MTDKMQRWSGAFARKVRERFGSRVRFIGIQGSHRRGEASQDSDIDMVVILDRLAMEDLQAYRELVRALPESGKMCGFISGKEQLSSWPRADLFQFYYDTQAIYGDLGEIFSVPTREEAGQALKVGAANLYHAACHCYLFEQGKAATLAALYKGAFFLLQALVFYRSGIYYAEKTQLRGHLSGQEEHILQGSMARGQIARLKEEELTEYFERLISWCADVLTVMK